ncbi:MAG: hypothetical protein DME23_03090 [Verrucomicrobia bacterium]|nr:MAG: hypothetical protein DME23_03090 [Verrucomicrobiota bacterium]
MSREEAQKAQKLNFLGMGTGWWRTGSPGSVLHSTAEGGRSPRRKCKNLPLPFFLCLLRLFAAIHLVKLSRELRLSEKTKS